jgi:hypothetical protein
MKILLTLFAILARSASAEVDIDLVIKSLSYELQKKIHVEIPRHLINVQYADQAQLRDLYCPGSECAVEALTRVQNEENGARYTIVLAREHVDLNTYWGQSILYHELIHVIQFIRRPNVNCETRIKNEIQAYDLQADFLEDHGIMSGDIRLRPRRLKCDRYK